MDSKLMISFCKSFFNLRFLLLLSKPSVGCLFNQLLLMFQNGATVWYVGETGDASRYAIGKRLLNIPILGVCTDLGPVVSFCILDINFTKNIIKFSV